MPTVPGTLARVDAQLLKHAGDAQKILQGVREHRARLAKSTTASAADLAQLDRAIHDLEETIGAVRFRSHGVHGLDAPQDRAAMSKSYSLREEPGHKYMRRIWDAGANHWKYIYHQDKHSNEHHFTLTDDEIAHHGRPLVDKHRGDVVGAALEAVGNPHVTLSREKARALHAVLHAHDRFAGGGSGLGQKLPQLIGQMRERAFAAKQGKPLDPLEHATNEQLESMYTYEDRRFRDTLQSLSDDQQSRLWDAIHDAFPRLPYLDYQHKKAQRQEQIVKVRALREWTDQAAAAIRDGRELPPPPAKTAKPPAPPVKPAPTNMGAKVTPQITPGGQKIITDPTVRRWMVTARDYDLEDLDGDFDGGPKITERELGMLHDLGMRHAYYSPSRPPSAGTLNLPRMGKHTTRSVNSADRGFVFTDRTLSEQELADNELIPMTTEARAAVGFRGGMDRPAAAPPPAPAPAPVAPPAPAKKAPAAMFGQAAPKAKAAPKKAHSHAQATGGTTHQDHGDQLAMFSRQARTVGEVLGKSRREGGPRLLIRRRSEG